MFNLDEAVAEWRGQMRRAGIKTPAPLAELECHLRDEIGEQMKSGLNAPQALAAAMQKIGRPNLLESEFKKVERNIMKRIIMTAIGIIGVLCGIAFILPALAWYHDHGAMPAEHLEFLLLGVAITGAGVSIAVFGFKKRRA